MRIAERKGVAGMLTHTHEGYVGGYGVSNYKEVATNAAAVGIPLVNIDINPQNAARIAKGGAITATYWDGATLHDVTVPARALKVVYDYGELDAEPGYGRMIKALVEKEKMFINGRVARQIANDKQLSQELFDEVGARTPITMQYSRDSVSSLLEQSGFIFIKDAAGTEGKNQVTMKSVGRDVLVKVDGEKTTLSSVSEALEFVENRLNIGNCIIQEGIIVPKIDDRVWDIRGVFQRNGSGEAVMSVALIRVGTKGRDQSNLSQGGNSQDPEVFLSDFPRIRADIESTGMNVLKGLERGSEQVGEMGMDFLVSTKGEVILIEINPTPGKTGLNTGVVDLGLTLRKDTENIEPEELVMKRWISVMTDWMRNPMAYAKYLIEQPSRPQSTSRETSGVS